MVDSINPLDHISDNLRHFEDQKSPAMLILTHVISADLRG